MTFVAPLFLIASLAAAIPIVLHMISRRRARELPLATLRFLRLSEQKTRRRKRLHDVLLMSVRAAALLLVAVGLARPTLSSLGSLWGGADTAVAIVLDNSASMGLVDQGRVRFRTALDAAEQVLDQLGEGDQVALLPSGGPMAGEQPRLHRQHEEVRQVLLGWINAPSQTGGVSYQRADLAVKVRQARRLLADSKASNRQVYVITDMQRISWQRAADDLAPSPPHPLAPSKDAANVRTDGPQPSPLPEGEGSQSATAGLSSSVSPTPPLHTAGQASSGTPSQPAASSLRDRERTGDAEGADIPVIVVDCNRAPGPNVAVQDVSLDTAVPVSGLPIRVTVGLLNGSSVSQQPHLELYVDGVQEQSSPALGIEPGGLQRHEFTFTPTHGGLHRGEVRLVGQDGSPLDDRRFFSFEVDQGIPVAIVKAQHHEIPYLEDAYYLEQALAPGRSGGWAIRANTLVADDLLDEPLSDYRAVFCVNLPAPDSQSAERLRSYVAGGGNLVWICGDNVEPEAYNQMDQQAAGQLLPAPLLDVRTAGIEEGRDSWAVGFLDPDHPALSSLADPPAVYQSVLVYRHVRLSAEQTAGAWVLARLDDGEPLLVERDMELGRVLMLGTGAKLDWSNLPLRPIFLPLVARLTFYLAGVEEERHELLAGWPLIVPFEPAARPTGVELILPGGEMIRRTADDQQGQPLDALRYDQTHEIGIYQVRLLGPGGGRQLAYAVNVDPAEADPARITREELQQRLGRAPLVFADDPDDLSATFALLHEGRSLRGPLLAGVLLVLVLESLLANRLSPTRSH